MSGVRWTGTEWTLRFCAQPRNSFCRPKLIMPEAGEAHRAENWLRCVSMANFDAVPKFLIWRWLDKDAKCLQQICAYDESTLLGQ